MRHNAYAHLLVLPVLVLVACQDAPRRRHSDWDHYDYARIAREKRPVDNDAYYTPPINTGCLDDAPNNADPTCQ